MFKAASGLLTHKIWQSVTFCDHEALLSGTMYTTDRVWVFQKFLLFGFAIIFVFYWIISFPQWSILLSKKNRVKYDSTIFISAIIIRIFLPTAYVARREGYVLTRVCPSVCPHLGGSTLARSRWGWGTPARSSLVGTPPQVPLSDLAGGYPWWGVPHLGYPYWTWPVGYPSRGYPCTLARGYPNSGTPPSDLAGGWGVPLLGGTSPQVIDWVLDTPRSVYLLRSRRGTFLL